MAKQGSQMNYSFTNDDIALLEGSISSHLPDCAKLSQNAKTLLHLLIQKSQTGFDPDKVRDEILSDIDFYEGGLQNTLEAHGVVSPCLDVQNEIQLMGVDYILLQIAKSYGVSVNSLKKRLKDIEKTSVKLMKLLTSGEETALIMGALQISHLLDLPKSHETTDEPKVDRTHDFMFVKLSRLLPELDFLKNIFQLFADSYPGRWLQFGASGPKENSALNVWIWNLAKIWTGDLNRSLTSSSDPDSGRERFLTFAETMFEAIHPNLIRTSPDVVRNAYEKMRSQGEFDYPQQFLNRLV